MKKEISYWYKDWNIRLVILINWIILLALVNWIIYFYFINWYVHWLYYCALFIVWISFWNIINIVNNLKYEFTNNDISIVLPNFFFIKNKTYVLKRVDIKLIEKLEKLPYYYWIWIKFRSLSWDIMFTTSLKNVYRITMLDWRKILISPKNWIPTKI